MISNLREKRIAKVIYGPEEQYGDRESLKSLFERSVSLHSGKTAISFGEQEMTYSELGDATAKVARLLQDHGLMKGDFVGIYMERSMETVISIFGVLRAGGVYVPIDPEHPLERTKHVAGNSSCKYILTKDEYEAKAKSLTSNTSAASVLSISGLPAWPVRAVKPVTVHPDDMAYVIYTSGSTGLPKGAMLNHRGVVNLCHSVSKTLNLTADDVVTQFSTFSFDAAVFDTFNALLKGAHLAMLTKEEQLSPEALADRVYQRQATFLFCLPTSVFNRMAENIPDSDAYKLSSIQVVLVAGEALLSDYVRKFQNKFGSGMTIVNGYGPTECTVCATMYPIKGYWDKSSVSVPIGYPLGNYNLYVVKEDGSLADPGESGELYIESVGLARGYLNMPDKTAESFIRNPFVDDPRSIVYKTGDIVKVLEDGGLEFLFRKDGQLKLRGFRIEIGEIENALSKHPGILDAVVVPIKEGGTVKHLSCFYSETAGVSVTSVKEHLKQYVPGYMIPSYFYKLPEIPLAPTGKVDRGRLALMDHPDQAERDEGYEPPAGTAEQAIAEVWKEVLKLSEISRSANFFDLGGDSLAVIEVLSHLKLDYFQLRISDLYRYQTIKDLAAYAGALADREEEEETDIADYYDLTEMPKLPEVRLAGSDGLGRDVLITGATGYLGSHLAYELLTATQAHVHLLVRAKNGCAGKRRLIETFDHYFGQGVYERYASRIHVVEGELTMPDLGVDNLAEVAAGLSSIIHAGADVRHFGNTDHFQAVNVEGTKALLQLVQANPQLAFHFISTVGIPEEIAARGEWAGLQHDAELFYKLQSDNVYTNSKLQAERAVAEAIQQGLPCRVGNLSCHSETGRFQNNINENFFYRMIKGFLLLKKVPEVNSFVDITPIDFASRFIVQLAKEPVMGSVYHICNPVQVHFNEVISLLMQEGYELEAVPVKAFRQWVLSRGNAVSEEGVQLVMAYLDGDGLYNADFKYSSERSFAKAQRIGQPPEIEILMKRLVQYAAETGYFPLPSR
ncbi:non-ribosomal peptide synthetase [Paenibacillus protaetiae]|uniref:Amino acid adenylation domain-containing protein n=1 Tax=Paenibacillus protaetiae TaxID=2509456 RepID=A0A4P6ETY2_9BACL|nr:amino acid adenylation domain-containing protein [Paenibacillus protaetiae]QAY65099.1 amino acid adenylation domain-containing protein [Paenibacillus protaetiae]